MRDNFVDATVAIEYSVYFIFLAIMRDMAACLLNGYQADYRKRL